jgi:pimeloyl-ACP methyl ester carboxylesterase
VRSGRPLGYTPLGDLIPTMRQDATVVQQSAGPLDRFAALRAETLLLGGDKSAPYLKAVLNGLEAVVPHVRRVTLPGAGHLAADNSGKPQLVADQLRAFFS